MKHASKRDLPHTGRPHPGRPERAVARRPVICLIVDDLGDAPSGVYGMYPASFIPQILPWLRCERREVLHVCSGGLPPGEGIRVDVRPEAMPDILADGRALPLADASVAAVLLDPPYSKEYAKELYGTEYPLPAHLLKEAARVVRHGGRIGIVHYITPNPPAGCTFVRAFGLSTGLGYPMRAVTIYEREQRSLDSLTGASRVSSARKEGA